MSGFFVGEEIEEKLRHFLSWYYPGRDPSDYNLEDVLAFLDTARLRQRMWGLDARVQDYASLYDQLVAFVKARLSLSGDTRCQYHDRLFRSLNSRDTIITLNYDLLADQTLARIEGEDHDTTYPQGTPRLDKLASLIGEPHVIPAVPALMSDELQSGFYLKLHGSLDWIVCPTPYCSNHRDWYRIGSSNADGQEEGKMCRRCGARLELMIVPPIAAKRIDERERLMPIWRIALQELAECQTLVVIGIAFNQSDHELNWLIRQSNAVTRPYGPLQTVHIVNPSDKPADELLGMLPRSVESRSWKDLAAYVAELR